MALRITVIYRDAETEREFDADNLMIGRLSAEAAGLDLSADQCVSRQHAFLQFKNGACWLTDLGSRYGTQVNGREIRGQGEWRLWPDDSIVIGETTLRVSVVTAAKGAQARAANSSAPTPARAVSPTPPAAPAFRIDPPAVVASPPAPAPGVQAGPGTIGPGSEVPPPVKAVAPEEPVGKPAPNVQILQMIDTGREVSFKSSGSASAAERRLGILLDLPRQFSTQSAQNELLQTIMNRLVDVIPAARRGALLLRDQNRDTLLLKAYVSADEPAVSETLARRALDEKRAFIWRSSSGEDTSLSMKNMQMVSGMYAPLRWQDQVYGVVCVDSPDLADHFEEDDLQFLIALGQYAAMALADQEMRLEMMRNTKLVDRLMANFSPKLRAVLVDRARSGKLRPGGTKSEVTILFCDICGFTKQSAQMDAHDVVDMLNHYFQPLVETLFRHDGTVDKFVGDAVLAVFGSPEPDPQQHQKAVRAALAMHEAVLATSQLRAARGDPTCNVRIGIHCGEVFHGFVGTTDRLEFTVIGDAVNRTCRYCEGAREKDILISQEIFQRVFNLIKAEKTAIQTKEGDLSAFRVLGLKA